MKLKLPFNNGKIKFYLDFPGTVYRESRTLTKVYYNGRKDRQYPSAGILMCTRGEKYTLEVNYEEKAK